MWETKKIILMVVDKSEMYASDKWVDLWYLDDGTMLLGIVLEMYSWDVLR